MIEQRKPPSTTYNVLPKNASVWLALLPTRRVLHAPGAARGLPGARARRHPGGRHRGPRRRGDRGRPQRARAARRPHRPRRDDRAACGGTRPWEAGACSIRCSTSPSSRAPCAPGAIVLARVPRVVFGTTDPKAGAAGSVLDVLAEPAAQPPAPGGVRAAGAGVRRHAARVLRLPALTARPAATPPTAEPGAECSNLLSAAPRRGGRAVECAGLENRYGLSVHRGFESPPLRVAPPAFPPLPRE